MIIPRYATIGQDCESAQHGTIRRHQGRGLLTPTAFYGTNIGAFWHCVLKNERNYYERESFTRIGI